MAPRQRLLMLLDDCLYCTESFIEPSTKRHMTQEKNQMSGTRLIKQKGPSSLPQLHYGTASSGKLTVSCNSFNRASNQP